MATTSRRVPVFSRALPMAAELGLRDAMRRVVPSTPAMDSECSNAAPSGWPAACCSRADSEAAVARSLRDRPEPFSTTGVVRRPKRSRHQRLRRFCDSAKLPRPSPADSVRNSCCAITLFENLLMSAMMSDSGSEKPVTSGWPVAGRSSHCTCPVSAPPLARHMASITRGA